MARDGMYNRCAKIGDKFISFGSFNFYKFYTPNEKTYKTVTEIKKAIEEKKSMRCYDKDMKEEFYLDYKKVKWIKIP